MVHTDDAPAALLDTKREIGIGGERFRPDDPNDVWSQLDEPEIFPVMVRALGAVILKVVAALPTDLEACRQRDGLTLQPFRLSGDRDLAVRIIAVREELERPPWRLESEALYRPPVANREHAYSRDLEEA